MTDEDQSETSGPVGGKHVRDFLHREGLSARARYAALVVGTERWGPLLRYELLTTFLGPLPGALGLQIRAWFYPMLFKAVGRGVVFGRSLVLRNAHNVSIGSGVVLDDLSLVDGRGAGLAGVVIGDRVIVNRGAAIQAKDGPIQIGADTIIGAGSTITSRGSTWIGEGVDIAGGCRVGGGRRDLSTADAAGSGTNVSESSAGPVRVEDHTLLGRNVIVMDGVTVGARSIVGAGLVLRKSVPPDSVVVPNAHPRVLPRSHFGGGHEDATPSEGEREPESTRRERPARREAHDEAQAAVGPDLRAILLRAVSRLNQEMPPESRIPLEPDAPLLEPSGPVDSMGLVQLILFAEEEIHGALGIQLTLAEHAFEVEGGTPFRSVEALAQHVARILDNEELVEDARPSAP